MVILGLDPGLQKTGWGVIRVEKTSPSKKTKKNLTLLGYGVIRPPLAFKNKLPSCPPFLQKGPGSQNSTLFSLARKKNLKNRAWEQFLQQGTYQEQEDSFASSGLSGRLAVLYYQLEEIIHLYQPTQAAVEETFVNRNPLSALKLGMARGVILLAPARANIPVGEYGANKVKKSVVGVGHADKKQVALMIDHLLDRSYLPQEFQEPIEEDAADALAVAICHAHHQTSWGIWTQGSRSR